METSELVKALTGPFAAGFVVQRIVEILDTYTTARSPTRAGRSSPSVWGQW
jgi:hypothetical protein